MACGRLSRQRQVARRHFHFFINLKPSGRLTPASGQLVGWLGEGVTSERWRRLHGPLEGGRNMREDDDGADDLDHTEAANLTATGH